MDDFSVLSDSWVAEFSAHLRKNVQLEKYALFQQDFLVAAVQDTKIDLVWAMQIPIVFF